MFDSLHLRCQTLSTSRCPRCSIELQSARCASSRPAVITFLYDLICNALTIFNLASAKDRRPGKRVRLTNRLTGDSKVHDGVIERAEECTFTYETSHFVQMRADFTVPLFLLESIRGLYIGLN